MKDKADQRPPRRWATWLRVLLLVLLLAALVWVMSRPESEAPSPTDADKPKYSFKFTVDEERGAETVNYYAQPIDEFWYVEFTLRGHRYRVEGVLIDVLLLDKVPPEKLAQTKYGGPDLKRLHHEDGSPDGVHGEVIVPKIGGTLSGKAEEAEIAKFFGKVDRWGDSAEIDATRSITFPLVDVNYLRDLPDVDVRVDLRKVAEAHGR